MMCIGKRAWGIPFIDSFSVFVCRICLTVIKQLFYTITGVDGWVDKLENKDDKGISGRREF
jgi:hypothetical protein